VFSRSYWRWVDYWFEITELNFGQKTYKVKKIGKIKDEERFQQYLSKFVLRRDIELDVEKHTHEVFSSLDEETRRAYVSMNRHMFCELPNGEIVNATNAATQLGRLRQLTISWQLLSSDPPEPLIGGKADDCVRIVNEDDTKVLVFSFYTGALERLHMRFEQEGIVSDLIVGKVKVHERLEKIRKFRSDPSIKVLLIQTKIAGSSITLNEAKRVIMLNDDYAPANDDQAHRRAYRKGQTEDINVYRLLAQKTVDTYNIRIIRDTKLSLYQALVSALEDQEILE
jgi:SNF2 family DNA or RNA helicase